MFTPTDFARIRIFSALGKCAQMGGCGRHFDTVRTWFAQAGVGMEYRFSRHVGVFLDARGVLPNETKYYGVARLGMRFVF